MGNFDLFMGIPSSLKLTERQRKAIDKLDLYNRRAILKTLMAEQGIDDDGNQITEVDELHNPYLETHDLSGSYQVAENDVNKRSDAFNKHQAQKNPSYIFSQEMRDLLGREESSNNYAIENEIGALGRYQLTKTSLEDIGYRDHNGRWTGKNGIYSKEDFFNNHKIQEDALDEYLKKQNGYLKHFGAYNYLNKSIKGKVADFKISETGLLAATHREGIGPVCDYLNTLETNSKGQYYMDYSKLSPKLREKYEHIETRLREFEK